jgi:hypothetical protein
MSFDSHRGKRSCSCDVCGRELRDEKGSPFLFDRDEFDIFLERLREAGWKSQKNAKGEWEHFCEDDG